MAEIKKSRWERFTKQLRNQYRLVILNDRTFAERFSLKLSPLGLLIGAAALTIVMTTLVISLVAFTPLREYIPGYGNVAERKQILQLSIMADSLEQTLSARDLYISNLVNVLTDKVEGKPERPKKDTSGKYKNVNTQASEADRIFRKEIENTKNAELLSATSSLKAGALSNTLFFMPVKGLVVTSFNAGENHFGCDIVSKKDELIKSTLDGTVIFAGFTNSDGYELHIQHTGNIISVYKHNSTLLKRVGDRVKSGESIAVIGNSGESSKGPHLHFEIWYNGVPVNPEDVLAF
ncbi:MAG: M23 family metallopeptidase [Sediminibacterium sp.]|nr:M23 family metallopeptidase [Sediminibacterium sp.]